MSSLVIVVSDLYFAADAALPEAGEMRLPGLARMARFGKIEALPRGWRSWLAAWLGRDDLAGASPAAVAAASLTSIGASERRSTEWVWLADPLHLTASLTSLHVSPRGLLRLDPPAQAALCSAFNAAFAETGYALAPTRSGRFIATGPASAGIDTTDPARCLGSSLSNALPQGPAAGNLRRLGTEIEMWLHEHPINVLRAREGQPPISTLWLWGGGAPLSRRAGAAAADNPEAAAVLFGDDPYVEGLSRLVGAPCESTPRELASMSAAAAGSIVHLELFSQSSPGDPRAGGLATAAHALEALDHDWIAPALERLARREISRLIVVANDRQVSLRARDRLKRWRRPRAALAALNEMP